MSAVRYWEDSIAAQGPVIDGHVTGIAVDDQGRTIMTIQPGDGGHPIKVQVEGNLVMSTGFPVERIPGTPRRQTPDKAIAQIKAALQDVISTDHARKHQAQRALHEIENLSGLELKPGQREGDLAAAKKALKQHGLEHAIESKAKDAYDMILAMDWDNLSLLQHQAHKRHHHKIQLLMRFAGEHESATIPDPYQGATQAFDQALDYIEDACSGLLEVARRRATQVAAA